MSNRFRKDRHYCEVQAGFADTFSKADCPAAILMGIIRNEREGFDRAG